MVEPPLFDGVVNVITAWPLPAVATTLVGALATVIGVTPLLVDEDTLVPTLFVAVTVNV
jgi:hypothetical protein